MSDIIWKSICEEADHLVSNDRLKQYGHPLDNFTDIGKVWGMILNTDPIPPEIVGLMMAGLKLCRQKFLPKRDNLVDLAGYAKSIDLVLEEKQRRKLYE